MTRQVAGGAGQEIKVMALAAMGLNTRVKSSAAPLSTCAECSKYTNAFFSSLSVPLVISVLLVLSVCNCVCRLVLSVLVVLQAICASRADQSVPCSATFKKSPYDSWG